MHILFKARCSRTLLLSAVLINGYHARGSNSKPQPDAAPPFELQHNSDWCESESGGHAHANVRTDTHTRSLAHTRAQSSQNSVLMPWICVTFHRKLNSQISSIKSGGTKRRRQRCAPCTWVPVRLGGGGPPCSRRRRCRCRCHFAVNNGTVCCQWYSSCDPAIITQTIR